MDLARIRLARAIDLEPLHQAAAADGHAVLLPSHVIEKEGSLVGYLGLGTVCVMNLWVDSKKVQGRESVYLLQSAENIAAGLGVRTLMVPCARQSPFYPLMERLGFERLGDTTVNLKLLQ